MARIVALDGPKAGAVFEVGDDCLLGRSTECRVVVRDRTVSRRHARITHSEKGYLIEGYSSVNQTLVNGVSITGPSLLSHADVIQMGALQFRFEVGAKEGIPDVVTEVHGHGKGPQIVRSMAASSSMLDSLGQHPGSEDLEKLAERLRTVGAIARAIGQILDPDDLLKEILTRVLAVIPGARRSSVLLKAPEGKEMIAKCTMYAAGQPKSEIAVPSTILRHVMNQREAVLSRDASADERFDRARTVHASGARAVMCAPMIWRDDVMGVLYLDSSMLAAFTASDLELLNAIADQAATALSVARLHAELMEKQRLERDLRLAERIQRSFLPRRVPKLLGYQFAARYVPARTVGGDFYDFITLPGQRFGIAVADVSGKGIGAALYMSRLSRDLRFFALTEPDPAAVMHEMNRAVIDAGQDHMFVTMVYAVLDLARAELVIANAGHLPPIIRHEKERFFDTLSAVASMPLGIDPDTKYDTQTARLAVGDTLLLYTDGLVEALNPASEMFGEGRLLLSIGRGPSGAVPVFERALFAMEGHVAGAPQSDDVTLVCMSFNPDATANEAIDPLDD